MKALSRMSSSGGSSMLIVENDKLAGIVTLKDLARVLSVKMELDEDDKNSSSSPDVRV